MKLMLLFFTVTFFVVFFVAKLINYSARVVDAEKKILRAEICDDILKGYSITNAGIINSVLSSKNSPVRPENLSFSDGIMKYVCDNTDASLPECRLINLKDVVIDRSSEGAHGA